MSQRTTMSRRDTDPPRLFAGADRLLGAGQPAGRVRGDDDGRRRRRCGGRRCRDPAELRPGRGAQGRARGARQGLRRRRGHAELGRDRAVPGPADQLPALGQPARRAHLVRRLRRPRLRRRGPAARRVRRVGGRRRCAGYSDALRSLSTGDAGKQIFVPTSYYWWGVFYRKSTSRSGACEPPTTWDEFHALCETLKARASPRWPSAWRHAVGGLRLVRLPRPARSTARSSTGELLAGEHAFDDPEVVASWRSTSGSSRTSTRTCASYPRRTRPRPLAQDKTGMYLIGAFLASYLPEDARRPRLLPVPDHRPVGADRRGGAHRRLLRQLPRRDNPRARRSCLSYLASAEAQQAVHRAVRLGQPAHVARRRHVRLRPLVQKGNEMLDDDRRDHPVLQPRLLRRAAGHRGHRADQVPRQARPMTTHPRRVADGGREGLRARDRAGVRAATQPSAAARRAARRRLARVAARSSGCSCWCRSRSSCSGCSGPRPTRSRSP